MKADVKKKFRQWKNTLKEMGKIDKKILKNGSYSMLYTVILIAAVVVINMIVGEIPEKYTQIDVSSQKLYTISDETAEFLKNLDQDVTIYHIVQSGGEDDVLEKMLTRYEEASKHVTVEKKDPVLYPNFTSQYTDAQVSDNSLIVVHGDKSKVIADFVYTAGAWRAGTEQQPERKSGESKLPDRNTEPSFGRKCSRGYGMPYDNGSADGSFRRRGRENHYLSGTGWKSHDLYRLYIC